MNISTRGGATFLLATILAATAAASTACGGSSAAPAVNAPPASPHTAAERAATLNWLARTNQMWTKGDFSRLDQVTTAEAHAVYLAERQQPAGGASPSGRTPFRLSGLSITVPCHRGRESLFVAYADTDVFTLGQSMRPEAMVFQRAGGAWKLAAMVNQASASGRPRWPALCRAGTSPAGPPVLAPAAYGTALARVLNHASTGAAETTQAAAPFAVNSFFTGPDSINHHSAADSRHDRAGGVILTQRFSPAAGPALALPLSGGGYWLVGTFSQVSMHKSVAGIRQANWPDGISVASPRPTVVHQQSDTFITTYAATDPLRSAGGQVALDGFFGWPLSSAAS
jgi:hypothetical protein